MDATSSEFLTRVAMIHVTEEEINIDYKFLQGYKWHFHSRPIVTTIITLLAAFFVVSALLDLAIDLGYMGTYDAVIVAGLALLYLVVTLVTNRLRDEITTDTHISGIDVDYIGYQIGGVRAPQFVIVYDDGKHKRNIWCALSMFGGKKQLERGIDAFKHHGYDVREV